jgi:VCBS repeat-containing protein
VLTGSGGTDANATDGVADTAGADGAVVTSVSFGGAAGTVGSGLAGAYGSLVLNADGSYAYTLSNGHGDVQGLSAGESLTEVYSYQITDGDGDVSVATLTITIAGADDGVTIAGLSVAGGELVVDEDDLAGGSSPDAGSLTQASSFSFAAADGVDTVTVGGVTVVSGGVFVAGQTVVTATGTLSITGFAPVTAPDGTVTGGTLSYSYVLQANTLSHAAAGQDSVFDSFAVVVTDDDGSSANASLDVRIVDDVPSAADDVDGVSEDGSLVADGNVLTGSGGTDANATDGVADTAGADGAVVTSVSFGGSAGTVGSGLAGAYGSLVLNADGSYAYTLSNGHGDVQGLSAGESLSRRRAPSPTLRASTARSSTARTSPARTSSGR